jgi:hypothetical protein
MAEPLILWSETLRFLELLGRPPESMDALLFPPKEGPGSDKGGKKVRLDEKGREGVERLLSMPLYRFHALGIRPNPGGSKAEEITEGRALFFEADGGLPIEAQEALPELLGLPEPTVTVWTGGKSVHVYWAAPEGEEITVEEWRKAQARLIAAVKEVAPEAGVDEAIKDPSRLMRCPGSVHPATGERCRIHSASGKRYNLAALVEKLPAAKGNGLRRPDLPAEHCANRSPEEVRKHFVRYIAPELKRGGLDVRGAISELKIWRKHHPEVFADWDDLCWKYLQQDPAWINHLMADGSAVERDKKKALDALASLPPLEFTSYGKWLGVGMALHSVSEELLPDWIQWSRGLGDAFNEEEHAEKWQSFSSERDSSISLGSLIHWAKEHGYRPPASADTSSATEVPSRKADPSSPPPLAWSALIGLTLEAVKAGDMDAEMELRAEIAGRFRRNDAQVDAALFRLLTEQEAGPKKAALAESVDLRTVQGLDYLVDGFLPANGLALSYGAKGAGKTTAAVALGFSVVDGRGFLDHSKPSTAGKVLFIASDSGAGPLRTVIQEMGHGEHEALIPGEGQRFFVWAHEADQGHSAWDVSVRGCVKLLQFVKEKGITLVVIDSAKAVCAKAGLSYTDNDAVNALLTFMKEVVTPHASVLFLSHDGTAVGSHAGAKAWAEIVDVVHRQTRPEGDHRTRTWTVVKNRLGPTREFSYSLEEGELVLAHGVETIGDASSAVLKVLRDAHERGKNKLSRKGIHEEVFKRFDFAPKTIDNTLQRLVQGKAPRLVRKGKGFYALSPKELYRGCLVEGEEYTLSPSPASDLPITQALPEENYEQLEKLVQFPLMHSLGNRRVRASGQSYQGDYLDSSPKGIVTPLVLGSPELEGVLLPPESGYQPGDAVEVLVGNGPHSGWRVVAASGVVTRVEHESTGEIRELAQSDLLFCCPF